MNSINTRGVFIAVIIIMITLYSVANLRVNSYRTDYKYKLHASALPVAPELMQAMAGEFKGLFADYLLLEAASFIGSKQFLDASPEDYDAVARLLDQSSKLDPYFRNTYLLTHGSLPWIPKKYAETLTILERSKEHLPWDWLPGFLIGFDYFYFLEDDSTASQKLMETSRIPGVPSFLATMAAQLAANAGKIDTAIEFLVAMYEKTEEEKAKNSIKQRITALQGIKILNEAVSRYTARFGKAPEDLNELVETSTLDSLPENPYNRPYTMKNGQIHW
jgi:hypothetical protein